MTIKQSILLSIIVIFFIITTIRQICIAQESPISYKKPTTDFRQLTNHELALYYYEQEKIIRTKISPVYTLEEYKKSATKAIYEILKKK
ncbi:MAG: hypothetical protein LBC20_00520 [Planctomycetaceae bacterium]|nr:hypothetical protein [Planctomycetaceae bacterium]